ncbi:hypothetical protein [Cellulosimicrobium cellulans]|uniref:hypothetical protein n=1 Tax=Cellulosimicrobium cellulans TaxID=1710 RepID=UPI0016526878|nr:hypothetical protein [Cellulosimicrobium cellulans]
MGLPTTTHQAQPYAIAPRTRYQVVGSMVIVDLIGGGRAYLERGALIPTNTRPDCLEHLRAVDLVQEIPA